MNPNFGFIPAPVIDLRAGSLYNVVISLLVFCAALYVGYIMSLKEKKSLDEKIFSFFLFALGANWLLQASGNFALWFNLPVEGWAYPVKIISLIPALLLFYYLLRQLFAERWLVWLGNAAYAGIALYYFAATMLMDGMKHGVSYWGIQWQVSSLPQNIYLIGLIAPLLIVAFALIAKSSLARSDASLYMGAIIYALLEYLQLLDTATWYGMLLRLFYILIAFGAYLSFIKSGEGKKFVPRAEAVQVKEKMRLSFFAKLLLLFILLAVIPITIASLLMFASFKEIIDIYVQKPLLFNLKTSREAFLLALNHVQVEALALMALTSLLVIIASVLASRAIAESMRRVSIGMERVSKGDFSFRLLPDSNDEIGDVVNYFNNMSEEIRRAREVMENWNRELEIKVRERTAELQTLFDMSKAIGSTLDLELLIQRTMEILGVKNYAYLNLDQSVRFANKEGGELRNPTKLPIEAKGELLGTLAIEADRELAEKTKLLTAITDQLAIAIENVGIYEKEKEAVARLTELDRLKNEFISMVSHELRTPVTSADGYVSLFLAGVTGAISDDQKKYLTIVRENNQRLLTLINRLLDFSKIETGRFSIKRELISINEIIDSSVDSMRSQLEKGGATLNLKHEAQHHNFMGDREKMREAIINLIENALKFRRPEEALALEIATRDAGDFIEVVVSDNGVGIEKEYLEKIFNKFFQIEDAMTRKVGGVGLGLALVKEIIGNHHGRIWAESEGKGKGSRFLFQLPQAEKA